MRLVGKNIAVRAPNVGPTQTPSGLFVAPSADTAQFVAGKVEFVGDAVETVTVGDTVHFNKFTSSRLTVKGLDYFILPYDQVLAVE